MAGGEGNGQAELEEVVCGLRSPTGGTVTIAGVDMVHASVRHRIDAGLGIVPSDRYRHGLVRDLPIGHNLVLDRIDRAPFASGGRLRWSAIARHGRDVIDRLGIKAAGPEVPASSLSGGHAQRVVLGRALRDDLRLLVASQPTRGLDVGAMEFVWGQLDRLRAAGVAVLLISSDLEEIGVLADRAVVLHRGRVIASFDGDSLDRGAFGRARGRDAA